MKITGEILEIKGYHTTDKKFFSKRFRLTKNDSYSLAVSKLNDDKWITSVTSGGSADSITIEFAMQINETISTVDELVEIENRINERIKILLAKEFSKLK